MPEALDLTEDLVRRVERVLPDPGPEPGIREPSDDDIATIAHRLLDDYGSGPVWVFAYGSLLWKPDFEPECNLPATAAGFHRAFCMRITRWRGTREVPGLMMALDRGGVCSGVAFRLPAGDRHAQVVRLLDREVEGIPTTNCPRWLKVATPDGPVRALGFVVNRRGPLYTRAGSLDEVAATLAVAAGHYGSCAAYLYRTVVSLETQGIRDRNLWALQKLVAERLRLAQPLAE